MARLVVFRWRRWRRRRRKTARKRKTRETKHVRFYERAPGPKKNTNNNNTPRTGFLSRTCFKMIHYAFMLIGGPRIWCTVVVVFFFFVGSFFFSALETAPLQVEQQQPVAPMSSNRGVGNYLQRAVKPEVKWREGGKQNTASTTTTAATTATTAMNREKEKTKRGHN